MHGSFRSSRAGSNLDCSSIMNVELTDDSLNTVTKRAGQNGPISGTLASIRKFEDQFSGRTQRYSKVDVSATMVV